MIFSKVDASLDSNPKIRRGGRNAREVFLFFLRRVQLLDAPGRLALTNAEPTYLADQLMMSEADAVEGVQRAVMARLIEMDDEISIVGWDNTWSRRPMTDVERKAKQRQRDRVYATQVTPAVTSRDGHADDASIVTSRDSHAGEETREDETRGEQRMGERAKPRSSSTTKPKRPPEAFREGWKPTSFVCPPGVNVDTELEKFRDYHVARGSTFVDWDAAWRGWLRHAKDFRVLRPASTAASALDQQLERVRLLEERDRHDRDLEERP